MKYLSFVIPVLLLLLFSFALKKKVKIYDSFAEGAAKGLKTTYSVFPYLVAVFVMTELFSLSGISDLFTKTLSPVFSFLNIPTEIAPLVFLKPFSGGGSLALLSEIFSNYGADSYVARCASVVFGSSETIFYVSAVYFSNVTQKKLAQPIAISIASTLVSTVFACFICRIFFGGV